MLINLLQEMFPVIIYQGLLIICTAETHRKYPQHRNVLFTFYKKKIIEVLLPSPS